MFSIASSVGMRLNDWNTNPTLSRRTSVSALSLRVGEIGAGDADTSPEVSSSSPATQCISVVLPEPDGPMIAVKRPTMKSTVTPSRARTSVSPEP